MAYFLTVPVIVKKPVGQADADIGTSRSVNLQPSSSAAAFETFGVEIANPYVLYDDLSGSSEYQVHGRVLALGKSFSIKAEPRVWDTLSEASHVMVLLEEVREL